MRIRYIYLPDYGPLKEVAVVFGQNEHIIDRKGAINFVVGLNGSGKSSLLRAIYDIFHSLSREELPKFPVTIAYDIEKGPEYCTTVFHRPRGPASECFLVPTPHCLAFSAADDWQEWIETKAVISWREWPNHVAGDQIKGSGDLRNWLPTRVMAYTSGALDLWQSMMYPVLSDDELVGFPEANQERPYGWTAEREYADTRTFNIQSLQRNSDFEVSPFNDRCFLVSSEDIHLAAISLGIWKGALDFEENPEDSHKEALRRRCLGQIESRSGHTGDDVVRRLLNEVDWLWPTHVSFLFSSDADVPRYAADPVRCFWLHALADTVIRHPLDESLSVVALGSRSPVSPEDLVGNESLEPILKLGGESMRNARCGAEALRRLFAGEQNAEESLWSIFQALSLWRASGLLRKAQLTLKRICKVRIDDQLDDCIISYSSLSDGEQMLLGRMALLLLLRGQNNSLVLLDEPETHFNDSWKRRIIDIVDDSILKNTAAHVIVSTHTSLTLTDVFSCEITCLSKEEGGTTARQVAYPTFGADPGRILLNVFGAPDIIGERAAEFLRSKLDPATWPSEDREKLRTLIDEIGSGWPRAKLMEILDELENSDASSDS